MFSIICSNCPKYLFSTLWVARLCSSISPTDNKHTFLIHLKTSQVSAKIINISLRNILYT